MNINEMLQLVIDQHGSDLHVVVGSPAAIRVDGQLIPIQGMPRLTDKDAETLIYPVLTQEQKDYILVNKELDFGYQFEKKGRFRVNVYYQQGMVSAAFRLIPTKIKTIDELMLPPALHDFTKFRQGIVLLTGPTGEGKSTTLAAMLEEMNQIREEHIITIEDPIEFIYEPKKSIISQREVNQDTHGWDIALRSALREDPDVVLVGEIRDYETIAAALTIAETGHLVLTSLHTNSAAQTIDRIIDVFPENQQAQVRQQLAATIQAIVAQRLVPKTDGGRIAATEIMLGTPAVRNLIREGKTFQLDNVIQTSSGEGMMLMETNLVQWVQRGVITKEVARAYSIRPDEFDRLGGRK